MNKDLIQAAAIITVELLQRSPTKLMDATPDVIASAFEAAYMGVEQGMERVGKELSRRSAETYVKLDAG